MTIIFASDHAGYELKEQLEIFVREVLNYTIEDHGPHAYDEQDDYPDCIAGAARVVAANPDSTRGIFIGGSGQGEAIVANRFKGVRAAVYYGGNPRILTLSREHNNANVLSLGARFMSVEEAKDAVRLWLDASFLGEERHRRRIAKIEENTNT